MRRRPRMLPPPEVCEVDTVEDIEHDPIERAAAQKVTQWIQVQWLSMINTIKCLPLQSNL